MQLSSQLIEMTCAEYSQVCDFNTICDEMFWDGGCDTELMFTYMKREAKKDSIRLLDTTRWDYESSLYQVYLDTEKGLS